MRPVKAGDWVTVPAGEDREVATVLLVEPGALVVAPQTGQPARRVPAYRAATPSGRPLVHQLRQRRGQLV